MLVNGFIKSWDWKTNSLVPIELLFGRFFVSWISQGILKISWSHHFFLKPLRRRHLPCWASWSFLTIAGSWHWRSLLYVRLLINFLSLRHLARLRSCICFTKWSSRLISSSRKTCSWSKFLVSIYLSTMKRASYVIVNRSIKVFSKWSRQIWIIFWVFSEIWSPFKFTNYRLRFKCFWICGESKFILYITNHIERFLLFSSNIVKLLVPHFKVRINSLKSFIFYNIKSFIPCWDSSSWVLIFSFYS